MLLLAPFVLLFGFVLWFQVDIPYMDQWLFLGQLHSVLEGQWRLEDLTAQHNEHRILIPRLAMIGLALVSGWNTDLERLATCALIVLLFAAIVRLLRLGRPASAPSVGWPAVVIAFFLCSWHQYETLLWGWELTLTMGTTATVGAIVLLGRGALPIDPGRVIAAGLLAFVASHSFANGLLVWPLGFLLLAAASRPQARPSRSAWWVWGGLGALAFATFFWDFEMPDHHRFIDPQPVTPATLTHYMALWFGVPLLGARYAAWLPGLLVVGAFGLLAGWAWRARHAVRAAVPMAAIGAFALGCGVVAAACRTSHGVAQALSSRYVSISTLLWVAVLGLSYLLARHHDERRGSRASTTAWTGLSLPLLVVLILGQEMGVRGAQGFHDMFSRARGAYITGEGLTEEVVKSIHPRLIGAGSGREVLLEHRLSLFRDADARRRAVPRLYPELRLTVQSAGRGERLTLRLANGMPESFAGIYLLADRSIYPLLLGSLDSQGKLDLTLPVPEGARGETVTLLAGSLSKFGVLLLSNKAVVEL